MLIKTEKLLKKTEDVSIDLKHHMAKTDKIYLWNFKNIDNYWIIVNACRLFQKTRTAKNFCTPIFGFQISVKK